MSLTLFQVVDIVSSVASVFVLQMSVHESVVLPVGSPTECFKFCWALGPANQDSNQQISKVYA